MTKYVIVIEPHVSPEGTKTWGAYAPDLPGCGVVGDSPDQARTLLREAISLHLEGLRADGIPIPPPSVEIDFLELQST